MGLNSQQKKAYVRQIFTTEDNIMICFIKDQTKKQNQDMALVKLDCYLPSHLYLVSRCVWVPLYSSNLSLWGWKVLKRELSP